MTIVRRWKWAGDSEPDALRNTVTEYAVASSAQAEYESEIEEWITNGWLKPYDERKYGPAKGLIPLMAVIKQNKAKVRLLRVPRLNMNQKSKNGSRMVG